MPINHNHILGKIRKEFDDAKQRGLVVVDFRPKEHKLDVGFIQNIEPQQIDRLCEYIRGKYSTTSYEVFKDDIQNIMVMRIMNDTRPHNMIMQGKMIIFDVPGLGKRFSK